MADSMINKDLGPVTAYALAKKHGYEGTEAEYVQSVFDAEAYSKGTRDGEDVGSGDVAYQNNAKYFKDQALEAKTAAEAAQAAAEAVVPETVTAWLTEHITEPEYPLDDTLTQQGAAADAKKTGDEISDLKSAIGVKDLMVFASKAGNVSQGITYEYIGDNKWYIHGTYSSGASGCNLFADTSHAYPFIPGKKYKVKFHCNTDKIYIQCYKYVGSSSTNYQNISGSDDYTEMTFPADSTGVVIRFRATGTVDTTVSLYIYEASPIVEDVVQGKEDIATLQAEIVKKLGFVSNLTSSDDMNDYGETGAYAYASSDHPDNLPTGAQDSNGVVTIVHGWSHTGFCVQYISTNNGKMFQRTQFSNGSWGAWVEITGTSYNTYYNTYENTYNITTSPTITTDSHGWLQAVDTESADESGKTDMTGAIMSMLNDAGYCHLGEGIFYVSGGIDMPDHSTLCGCGDKTVIRLLASVQNGYCVKMQKGCLIKDIGFSGSYSNINPTSDGHRDAIHFEANYSGSPLVLTEHCMMDNVWIRRFSGNGIYCHDTSINYARGLYATNVYIDSCYTGINITYYSEFNRFVNVCISWCYYACINNGGNNMFTSCTFHATNTGFYINGNGGNNAHGALTGCTFVHIGSNNGKAIHCVDVTNCFTFDACIFGLDSIDIENCSGIVFSNCQFHRGVAANNKGYTINISGGNTIMFVSGIFYDDITYPPEITVLNNTKVKFDSCYGSTTGNAITGRAT